MTVAIAAPHTPRPNVKMKSGSKSRLARAPMATESMPMVEYPWALIKGFIPTAIMDGQGTYQVEHEVGIGKYQCFFGGSKKDEKGMGKEHDQSP